MKVLAEGTGQKGWAGEFTCTGAGNGGGGVVREAPAGFAVEIPYGQRSLDQHRSIDLRADVHLADVVLVRDLTNDLFEDILECDETADLAVLVDDEGEL